MIVDKLITWYAEKWAKDNLTESNIKKAFKGLWEWLCDKNIQEALLRIVKFCLAEIIKEVKNNLNQKQ